MARILSEVIRRAGRRGPLYLCEALAFGFTGQLVVTLLCRVVKVVIIARSIDLIEVFLSALSRPALERINDGLRAHRCGKAQVALGAPKLLEVDATILIRKLLSEMYVGVAGGLSEALGVRAGFLLLLVLSLVELVERDLDGLGNLYVVFGFAVLVLVSNDVSLELLDELFFSRRPRH